MRFRLNLVSYPSFYFLFFRFYLSSPLLPSLPFSLLLTLLNLTLSRLTSPHSHFPYFSSSFQYTAHSTSSDPIRSDPIPSHPILCHPIHFCSSPPPLIFNPVLFFSSHLIPSHPTPLYPTFSPFSLNLFFLFFLF